MKLEEAVICIQCDELYPITDLACPSCLSEVFFPLTRIIKSMDEDRARRKKIPQ